MRREPAWIRKELQDRGSCPLVPDWHAGLSGAVCSPRGRLLRPGTEGARLAQANARCDFPFCRLWTLHTETRIGTTTPLHGRIRVINVAQLFIDVFPRPIASRCVTDSEGTKATNGGPPQRNRAAAYLSGSPIVYILPRFGPYSVGMFGSPVALERPWCSPLRTA